METGRAILT